MSALKQCDRCGLSVPFLEGRRLEGWIYLCLYNGMGDSLSIAWDVCPACKGAASEFFNPKRDKV